MEKQKGVHDIIMLANGHPVFDTRIFIKEATTLSRAGYRVAIIIPAARDEVREGVEILSVSLTATGWQKLFVNPWNILRKALRQSSQAVYHIHDSDILIVGVLLKLSGRKVIYDAHEDTPLQISYQHWLPDFLNKPYAWLYFIIEKICGWMFDRIVVAEPVIAKYFPEKKTHLVRNFPIAGSFQAYPARPYQERKKRVIHLGTLSRVRGLFEMLEGSEMALREIDFEFFLGGKFSPSDLEQKVLSSFTVTFAHWVSYSELVDLVYDSRIGIIIPHPIERYRTNYPVKLFEFMAAGIPVIASREGESAAFVREAACGILADPLDPKQISDAIVWLLTHPEEAQAMGKRGQQLIFTKYNWEKEGIVLIDIYRTLIGNKQV